MFKPVKEYKIAVDSTSTAEPALEIPELAELRADNKNPVLMLYAKGTDMVVRLGGDTVAADASLTSLARPDGNFTIPAGAIIPIEPEPDQTHISVIAEDESTATGSLIVTVGSGEY